MKTNKVFLFTMPTIATVAIMGNVGAKTIMTELRIK